MGECSALATKAELAAVEAKISGKIDKTEEPRIIQASVPIAASLGASIAIGATDPKIRAALAQLGALASKVGALATRVLDLFGKLAGVLSIIGLLATQAQIFILQQDVRQLKSQLRQVSNIAEGAVVKADIAINKANTATNTANAATREANIAVNKANQAINQANRAEVDAEGARNEANQAILKANSAASLANTARSEANQASKEANQAIRESNVAKSQANQAIGEANTAKSEARTSTAKANAATAKANEAIRISNQNAALIEQVNNDNKHLRAELFGIKFAQSLIPSEAERRNIELEERFNGKLKVLTVNGVTKEYIARTAAEGRAAAERDAKKAKERDKVLEDIIKSGGTGLSEAQVSKMIADGIKQEDKSIKDYIAGLPGIGTGTGIKPDGLTVGQVKDIARTETAKQVKELERVQERQYSDLRDKISALPGVIGGVVIGGIVTGIKPFGDSINKTVAQTSAPAITSAAAAGVCQTTKPGGCMNNLSNNQGQNIRDYINAAGTAASAANNALLLKMQGVLNALKATTDIIKSTTDAISKTVHHAQHGLKNAFDLANRAWKATHLDKVMSALSVVIALHNAAMLSRNLGQTLGDLTSQALSTIGIKDSEGSPLNINGAIGQQVNNMLTSILGAETYQGIKETWNKSSRILSSASQIVWTVRSIADSTREITEWTAENTGKIGNALRRFRVVGQNAYGWMPERMNSTNKWLARVERTRQGIDSLDDAASSFSSVLGEVNNIQQEYSELQEQKTKFKDNVKDLTPNVRDENTPVKDLMTDEKAASKAPNSMPDVFRGEGETS